jgi:hypothetical protein
MYYKVGVIRSESAFRIGNQPRILREVKKLINKRYRERRFPKKYVPAQPLRGIGETRCIAAHKDEGVALGVRSFLKIQLKRNDRLPAPDGDFDQRIDAVDEMSPTVAVEEKVPFIERAERAFYEVRLPEPITGPSAKPQDIPIMNPKVWIYIPRVIGDDPVEATYRQSRLSVALLRRKELERSVVNQDFGRAGFHVFRVKLLTIQHSLLDHVAVVPHAALQGHTGVSRKGRHRSLVIIAAVGANRINQRGKQVILF